MYLGKCPENMYEARIEFSVVKNDFLEKTEKILLSRKYEILWRDIKINSRGFPGEKYTAYTKKLGNENYQTIDIYIYYSDNVSNELNDNFFILIQSYRGFVVTQLRKEIEEVGNIIYNKFSNIIGENHITLK